MSRHKNLLEKAVELENAEVPFAIATVIMVQGSSSGKVGDKAIFGEDGKRIMGYIGGECIENRVARTAIETLADGNPRIINIDLNSDQMGMGIPCGGDMSVMIEPHTKLPTLLIRGMGKVAETLSQLGVLLNFKVVVQTPEEEVGRYVARVDLMTEPLELDDFEFDVDYLVLATHHRDDDKATLEALTKRIPFVAVLASKKKTGLIIDYLRKNGITDKDLKRLHAPAGLDLKAKTAEEIALSITAEMVMHRNGGTGKPMHQLNDEITPEKGLTK